jgi:hypothetical protein
LDIASRSAYSDLWAAVAEFDWPPDPPKEEPSERPIADMPERLLARMNEANHDLVAGLYADNAAHVTGERTIFSRQAIADWYQNLLKQQLPKAHFEVTGKAGSGSTRHYTWTARSQRGEIADGNDTLGLHEGKIQFHFSYYTVRYPTG